MVFLRQSQMLSLASVMLYLLPSGVLCDVLHYEDTEPATSDLTVMSIPEVCLHEVKKMLTNVATFCEGKEPYVDALTSCQDTKSNLVSQLEQRQSGNCESQLVIARSLLEKCLKQLSQSKERIRAMSGIAIRYQGDRTSLNDQLNRNHQQLLYMVDDMVRDIHKWKMNTSKGTGVSYRDVQKSNDCHEEYDKVKASFSNMVLEYEDCKNKLNELRNNSDSYEMAILSGQLNQTTMQLEFCNKLKGICDKDIRNCKANQVTLISFHKKEVADHNKTKEELEQVKKEYEAQLDECYNKMHVNIDDKEKFINAVSNLIHQIDKDSKHLQLMLENITSGADERNTLMREIRMKFKALRSVCIKLVQIKLSKTKQLISCENTTSNLNKDKTNLQKSLDDCGKETKKLKNNINVCQSNLISCNETTKQQEVEINKTHSENTQLKQNNINLDKHLHRCNESLQKENQRNMDKMTEIEGLKKELNSKENHINKLENNAVELNKEINSLKETLQLLVKEKENLTQELNIKHNSLDHCEKGLRNVKAQLVNQKSLYESNLNSTQEKNEIQNQLFTEKLKKCSENNTDLMIKKNTLESEKQKCLREHENLETKFRAESNELHECIGEKLNLTNTIVFKNRDIEDLQRDYDNMNLTSKLSHIKISTRISELEIKLRYLEYLLKSNRNEIKMLQEYGVILIMLVNKNADMLSLLKETFIKEGDGFSPAIDDRFEALLRRLLRSIEEHHSRIYTQLLQMKPYMDKVVPIRVRRQVQRGRPAEVALLGAAKQNNMTEVGILLDVGANVNAQDESGLTSLHWAAMKGHSDVAELLLCRGAEPNIQAQGRGIKTPLHLAAEYGHPDTVLVLLDFGSNIEARAMDHATPLLYAANRGKEQVVSILLQRGADIGTTNAYNKNILQLSAKFPKVIHVIQKYSPKSS